MPNTPKIPCVVTIEEISRRSVIIMVDPDEEEPMSAAEEIAEELCNTDKIAIDYEDFQERNCKFQHIATANELNLYAVFDPDNISNEEV